MRKLWAICELVRSIAAVVRIVLRVMIVWRVFPDPKLPQPDRLFDFEDRLDGTPFGYAYQQAAHRLHRALL